MRTLRRRWERTQSKGKARRRTRQGGQTGVSTPGPSMHRRTRVDAPRAAASRQASCWPGCNRTSSMAAVLMRSGRGGSEHQAAPEAAFSPSAFGQPSTAIPNTWGREAHMRRRSSLFRSSITSLHPSHAPSAVRIGGDQSQSGPFLSLSLLKIRLAMRLTRAAQSPCATHLPSGIGSKRRGRRRH